MGKLWLQVLAAALLAALLLFGARGGGVLAASVHQLARQYLRQELRLGAVLGSPAPGPSSRTRGRAEALQFSWPLVGQVVRRAGGGIEILAPGGALVRAAASGTVTGVGASPPGVVVTVAGGGVVMRYLHLGPSDVHPGEAVRRGEVIGALSHFAPGAMPHLTLEATRGRRALALPGVLGGP